MSKLRHPWLILFIAIGLLTAAGVASAEEAAPGEERAEDTLLNFGYDEENHVLIVNTSANDSTYDCTLDNETLVVGYGASEGDPIPVDSLEEEVEPEVFETFRFFNRPPEEVDTEFAPADGPVTYTGPEGDCGLSGGLVGGPNGQINHGQFMKLFHQLVDGHGMGCLNRVMAQSDLGKGDQQIRNSDVVADFGPGDTGEVDFTTAIADCNRDKHEKGEDHPGRGNKPDKAAKSGAGKSGDARGHNK